MTPAEVKAIRLSMRTSQGRPPSQKKFAEFLGMGQSTIARFEANLAKPSGSSVSVLRLCQLPGALKILVIHAEREGRFSDIVEQKRDFIFVAGE